jgi:hypothetical protein
MADQFNVAQAGTLSPEDYAQQQALNRQQRFAEMLMGQNQQPQGQMVSGRYVPRSFFEMLQPAANMIAGAYIGKQSDTEAAKLAEKIRQAKGAKEEAITNLITGTSAIPAVQGGIQGPNGQMTKETTADMYGPDMSLNPQYKQVAPVAGKEATKPDLAAALREMNTNNPYGAGAEYKAALVGNMIPKKTDQLINYEAYKAETPEGKRLSFTDWSDRNEKQRLEIDRQRLAIEQSNANKPQLLETPTGFVAVNPRNPSQSTPVMYNGQPLMGKNPLNETQAKASLYQGTMLNSTKEMQQIESSGFNPATFKNQATLSMGSTAAGNTMMPENAQRYKQASDAFANSYIRFQSGAGINQDEIQRNLKNMMPSLGDKQGQIEQKQRAREEAIRLMGTVAGSGNQLLNKNQMPINPVNSTVQATPQIDPNLLQYMTPEQRKLFGK